MVNQVIGTGQIDVVVNADGADASLAKVGKSLDTLGKKAKTAGDAANKGVTGISKGASKAADTMEKEALRMARSIERVTAATRAGSSSNSTYFESIAKSRGLNTGFLQQYINQLKDAEAQNKKFSTSFGGIKSLLSSGIGRLGLAGGAAALFTKGIGLADDYTRLTAQLKLATTSQAEYAVALSNVQRISAISQSDLSAAATLYARLTNNLREFNVTQEQVSQITETTALALKVQGSTTEEAASAMLQLSQAFGSGKLQGDEFRSLAESAPNLMRQLAASIGVPYGALKELSSQGALTSEVLLKAFTDPKYLDALRKQAEQVQTVSGAWKVFANEFEIAIGKINEATGASKILIFTLEKAATLLSIFRGGEKGSILRNFIDTGDKANTDRALAMSTAELKEAAKWYGWAKEALAERQKKQEASQFSGLSPTGNIAPSFSVGIESQDIDKIHAAQEASARARNDADKKYAAERKRIRDEEERELSAHYENIAKLELDFLKGQIKSRDDVLGASESYNDAMRKELSTTQEQIEVLQLGEDGFNRLQITRLQDAIATNEQTIANAKLNGATEDAIKYAEDYNEKLIEQLEIKQQLADAKLNKKSFEAEHKRIDDLQKAQDEAIKKTEETATRAAESMNQSITDALLRGFESGNDFAKNFRDTLKNLFQTLILRPVISFIVNPVSQAISATLASAFSGSALAGGGSAAGGASSGGFSVSSALGGIKDVISNLNGSIVGSIESLGTFLSTGTGGLGDAIGGFLGQYSSQIATGFSYFGAALQLAKGNFAGAALTAAGTLIGGPIGGAIGGIIGSALGGLFGGGRPLRNYSRVNSSMVGGDFNITNTHSRRDGNKFISPQESLVNAYSGTLNSFLGALGINQDILTQSQFSTRPGSKTRGTFSGSVGGTAFNIPQIQYGSKDKDAFAKYIDAVMGEGLAKGIQASSLSDGIKKFFDGLTKQADVLDAANTISGLITSLKDLPPVFNAISDAINTTLYTTSIADLKTRFAAIGTYTSLFYTEQENFDTFTKQLTTQFGALNQIVPPTRDGFRNLVDSLMNDFSEAGRTQFNGLLALAPAADAYYKQLTQQKEALEATAAAMIDVNNFTSLSDYRAAKGIANNYGSTLALDYVSNLNSGRIGNAANGQTAVNNVINEEVVQILRELRDYSKQNVAASEGTQGALDRISVSRIQVAA